VDVELYSFTFKIGYNFSQNTVAVIQGSRR